MATVPYSTTITSVVTVIHIDPVSKRLTVTGNLTVPDGAGGDRPVEIIEEDVTVLLDAGDITAIQRLVTRAQAWIDTKLP